MPGGCEATRRYIDAMPDGHVVAKIDFNNAFNSLRRDLMLRSIASTVPGIYRFCHHTSPIVNHLFSDSTLEQSCLREVRTKVIH